MKKIQPNRNLTLESDRDVVSIVVAGTLITMQFLSEILHSRTNVMILGAGTLMLLVVQLIGHMKKFIALERQSESESDQVDTIFFRGQKYSTLEDEDAERGLLTLVSDRKHGLVMNVSLMVCTSGIAYAFVSSPSANWRVSTAMHLLSLIAWSQAYLPRHNVAALVLGFLALSTNWKPEMSWWQSAQTLAFIPLVFSAMVLRIFQNGIRTGARTAQLPLARCKQLWMRATRLGLIAFCFASLVGWMTSKSEEETFLKSLNKNLNQLNLKAGELAFKMAQKSLKNAQFPTPSADQMKQLLEKLPPKQIEELRESKEWQEALASGRQPSEADLEAALRLAEQLAANMKFQQTSQLAPRPDSNSGSPSRAGSSNSADNEESRLGQNSKISPELAEKLMKSLAKTASEAGGQTAGEPGEQSSQQQPANTTTVSKRGEGESQRADGGSSDMKGSASKGNNSDGHTGDEARPEGTPSLKSENATSQAKADSKKPEEPKPLIDPKTIDRLAPWIRFLVVIGIMALIALLIEPLFRKKKRSEDILDQDLPPQLAKEVLQRLKTLGANKLSVEDEIRVRYMAFLDIMEILRNPRPDHLPTWEFHDEVRLKHVHLDEPTQVLTDVFSRFTYGRELPNKEQLHKFRLAFSEIERRTISIVRAYSKSA